MKRRQRGFIFQPLVAYATLILPALFLKVPETVASGIDTKGGTPVRPNVLRTVLIIKSPSGVAGLPEGTTAGTDCRRVVSLQDKGNGLSE